MKFSKNLLMFAAAGLMLVGCKQADKPAETADANVTVTEVPAENLQTASFSIEGMSCAIGCAKTIEKNLAKLDGVQKASVDFDTKTATIEFDSSKQSPEKFVEVVEAAADGKTYKVSDVKSSGDQAMLTIKEKEKEKKKKKKKGSKAATAEEKKEGCAPAAGKPGCCSAKKAAACHEEKTL